MFQSVYVCQAIVRVFKRSKQHKGVLDSRIRKQHGRKRGCCGVKCMVWCTLDGTSDSACSWICTTDIHGTHNHNRASYSGPLYQVNRTLDGALLDIGVLTQGGFANASAQDAFCKATPSPSPKPLPPSPLPPLQSTVYIVPIAEPTYSFRHCDAQGFVTPFDGNADHSFKLVAALNGDASCVSFQSVNFPAWYIAPIAGAEPDRLGLVQEPKPADASWTISPASGGRAGFMVTLPSRNGLAMSVGGNLTGLCAGNYDDGSHSVYVDPLLGMIRRA